MTRYILTIGIALIMGACGGQQVDETGSQKQVSSREQIGDKADGFTNKALSCTGACGDVVSDPLGYCGCDDECADYGDCCDDKAAVCDAGPTDQLIIDQSKNGQEVKVELGTAIDVQLDGNPTTGYEWKLLQNSRSFSVQKEEYIPDSPELTGSGGTYHFYYVADMFAVGNSHTLEFAYYRSWESIEDAAETFTVTVTVLPSKDECLALDKEYADALIPARVCQQDLDCDMRIGGNLSCGMGNLSIDSSLNEDIEAIRSKWNMFKCSKVDWTCPMYSPMPPWFEVYNVCKYNDGPNAPGQCGVEYVDTRATEEDTN